MQAYAISHFLYPYFRLPMHFSKGNETLNCRYSLVCQVFWLRIGDSVDNTACDLA